MVLPDRAPTRRPATGAGADALLISLAGTLLALLAIGGGGAAAAKVRRRRRPRTPPIVAAVSTAEIDADALLDGVDFDAELGRMLTERDGGPAKVAPESEPADLVSTPG
jgi:hypothetical protein